VTEFTFLLALSDLGARFAGFFGVEKSEYSFVLSDFFQLENPMLSAWGGGFLAMGDLIFAFDT
jgi:hypothetical protein